MPYEQIINTTVTGQQQMQAAVGSTDRLSESTKKMNDALYGASAATEKMTLAQAKLAAEEAKLEQLRERHRIQTEAFANSVSKAAASQDQLTAGTVRATGGVREMTSALRVMEGGMPIRTAAQFLTTIQGFGPAVSSAFPLIGAVALFGVVEKIGNQLGIHLDTWKQITEQQKQSVGLLRQASSEYAASQQGLASGQLQEYRNLFGPAAAYRRQATDSTVTAQQERQKAGQLASQLSGLQDISKLGVFSPPAEEAAFVVSLLTPESTAAAGIPGLEEGMFPTAAQQELVKKKITEVTQELNAARSKAQKADQDARNLQQAADKQDQEDRQREAERRQREAESAARKVEQQQRKLEGFDRAGVEVYSRGLYSGELSPRRKLDIANERIEQERDKALSESPGSASRINKDFDLQKVGVFLTYLTEGAEALKKFNEKVNATFDKAPIPGDFPIASLPSEIVSGKLPPPTGYISPADQMRLARLRGAGAVRGARGGSPYDVEAAEDLSADLQYKAQLRINELKFKANDLEAANIAALEEKREKVFQAQLRREDVLQELADKRREEFQNFAVGLFGAARSGNVGAFFRGQANSLADKVVGNAAGMAWPAIAGLIPHAGDPTSTIGKLLQGTPFGADPLKTATDKNTDATNRNSDLLDSFLRSAGATSGDYGGEFGPAASVPGLSSLAFSGPGGSFGAAAASLSRIFGLGSGASGSGGGTSGTDTGYTSDGVQRYSPENYGADGTYLGAGATSSHDPSIAPISRTVGRTSSTAQAVTYGAAAAAGGFAAYDGFSRGGAQGALQGTGAILGTAALIPGPQQPFIAAAAAITSIVSSFLGDPKQNRANQIAGELKYNQYMAPVAINASMTTGGTFADFDRFGSPRGSGLSPFPNISQGYFDYRNNTVVPGRTNSQFGGPTINVNVQTLDSRSFNDNSHLVADAMVHAMDTGKATSFQERLRN